MNKFHTSILAISLLCCSCILAAYGQQLKVSSETKGILSSVRFSPQSHKSIQNLYPIVTIHDIQFDPLDSLLKADTIQTGDPSEWKLQASPYLGDTVTVIGLVVIPPKIIGSTGQGFTAILYDTGVGNAPWSGILVRCNSPTDTLQNITDGFLKMEQGDIVRMTGLVTEFPSPPSTEMGSMTQFQPIAGIPIDILNPTEKAPLPPPIFKGDSLDQFYQGVYQSTGPFHVKYSTGEQYESMDVEFTHLRVSNYNSINGRNEIEMVDSKGNTVTMFDASRWFTVTGSWRDPSSTWTLPPAGTVIQSIHGIIFQTSGTSRTMGYVIAPMYPENVPHSADPIITNEKRTPDIIQTSQSFQITAQVYPNRSAGGLPIDSVFCMVSKNYGPFEKTVMSIVDTGNTYGASFNSLSANTFVRYFIQAFDTTGWWSICAYENDNSAGVVQYGSDTSKAFFNFTVLDHPPTIHDIQYTTYAIGVSPYVGATVTVGGIVTADSNSLSVIAHSMIYGTHAYYMQSGNQPWSGILLVGATGDTSLGKIRVGDSIMVTGTISEFGYQTQIDNILNSAIVISSHNSVPDPITLPTSTFSYGNPVAEQYESMLIRVVNTSVGNLDPVFSDLELYTVNDGSGALLVDIDGKNTYSTIPADTALGRTSILYPQTPIDTLTGIIYLNGNAQWMICPRTDADFAAGYRLNYNPGWNMVSISRWQIPSTNGYNISRLFPGATPIPWVFRFNGSYYTNDSIFVPGIGYWMKVPAGKIYRQLGLPIQSETVHVAAGWNMIGMIGDSIPPSNVVPLLPGNEFSPFFGYNKGYYAATELQPAFGYWVKADSDDTIIMSSSGLAKTKSGMTDLKQFNSITFSDARGGIQTLYFGSDANEKVNLSKYEMPPVAMEGMLDVRYSSNRILESYPDILSAQKKFGINVTSSSDLVLIKWNIVSGDDKSYALSDQDGNVLVTLQGKGSAQLTLSAQIIYLVVNNGIEMPKEYSLSQNYPNPFNPTTNFGFRIAVRGMVTLKIYDLLGREVATIVHEVKAPGVYSIPWNAGNIASGVYVYTLQAGTFSDTKKLVLLK